MSIFGFPDCDLLSICSLLPRTFSNDTEAIRQKGERKKSIVVAPVITLEIQIRAT